MTMRHIEIRIENIFEDLEDSLAESDWFSQQDEPLEAWLRDICQWQDLPHITSAGQNEDGWIVFFRDWVQAHKQPTAGMIIYIDWYEYQGVQGAKDLLAMMYKKLVLLYPSILG